MRLARVHIIPLRGLSPPASLSCSFPPRGYAFARQHAAFSTIAAAPVRRVRISLLSAAARSPSRHSGHLPSGTMR